MEIIVSNIFHTYRQSFFVQPDETIWNLRGQVAEELELSPYEVNLHGAPPLFPYPFADSMILGHLHEDHRLVYMIVGEDPENATPSRIIMNGGEEFDLRHLGPNDIPFLHRWLQLFHRRGGQALRASAVHVSWSDPRLADLLFQLGAPRHRIAYLTDLWIHSDPEHEEIPDRRSDPQLWSHLRQLLHTYLGAGRSLRIRSDPGILGNLTPDTIVITPEHLERVDVNAGQYLREMAQLP